MFFICDINEFVLKGWVIRCRRRWVTTEELERRLAPVYERLRLPEGRLELMTGIRERRFFPVGVKPSEVSLASAEKVIVASGIDRSQIGALVAWFGLPRFFGTGNCVSRASWAWAAGGVLHL